MKNKQKNTNEEVPAEFIVKQLGQDVRNSVLVVSVVANLFFLIGWLVIQVTNNFDGALIGYLQTR